MGETELWKPIAVEEFSEQYQVSNLGKVWCNERKVIKKDKIVVYKPKMLKANRVDDYPIVRLHVPTLTKFYKVHILMLLTFVGPKPENSVGCHYDDVRTNNVLSNLRWDSLSANSSDATRNMLAKHDLVLG